MRQRRRIRNSTKPFVGRSTGMHFVLTGAPVFNTWCGIAGQLMLLPNGGPFVNLKHHSELVDSPASSQSNTPSKKESAILNMILASMTAGRPKEILQLPPIRYHEMRASTQAESHFLSSGSRPGLQRDNISFDTPGIKAKEDSRSWDWLGYKKHRQRQKDHFYALPLTSPMASQLTTCLGQNRYSHGVTLGLYLKKTSNS